MSSVDKEIKKTCAICRYSSNTTRDCVLFGDWMFKDKITVHYFCLLLSSHLPQNGTDSGGIQGFLMRDIRKEIMAAAERQCVFCHKHGASIRCKGCNDYFHLNCGLVNDCVSQFRDKFYTYCADCLPLNALQLKWKKRPPSRSEICFICNLNMGLYSSNWIYAPCCSNGFVHRVCMQKYALSAGYYLICIWCRNSDFREHVRMQGVFVPDRDAQWERQKYAYRELHRGHTHCDMNNCLCPRGRDFVGGKWELINCSLCGSVGAHNPSCIPGHEKSKQKIKVYKCDICSAAEHKRTSNQLLNATRHDETYHETNFDNTLYQCKERDPESQKFVQKMLTFSDDSVSSKESSVVTVVPNRSALAADVASDVLLLSPSLSKQKMVKTSTEAELTELEASVAKVPTIEKSLAVVDLCSSDEDIEDDNIVASKDGDEDTDTDMSLLCLFSSDSEDDKDGDDVAMTDCLVTCTDVDNDNANAAAASVKKGRTLDDINDDDVEAITEWFVTCTDFAKDPNAVAESLKKVRMLDVEVAGETFSRSIEEALENIEHEVNASIATVQLDNVEGARAEVTPTVAFNQTECERFNNIEIDGNFATFWMFDFSKGHEMRCTGTSKIRIDLTDPRYGGKTIEAILSADDLQFTDDEVLEESDDISIFEEIDRIIDEYRD